MVRLRTQPKSVASKPLNLSESSSSEDNDDEAEASSSRKLSLRPRKCNKTPIKGRGRLARKAPTPTPEPPPEKAAPRDTVSNDSDTDAAGVHAQLAALVSNLDQQDHDQWKKSGEVKPEVASTSNPAALSLESEISALLARGEAEASPVSDSDDDTEGKDLQELPLSPVKKEARELQPVEITVQVPGSYSWKKKKEFDLEAHLKREMSRIQREIQLTKHKTHILCLTAHLMYLNIHLLHRKPLGQLVLAAALSIVPPAHSYKPGKQNLNTIRLNQFLQFFRKHMTVRKGVNPDSTEDFPRPLQGTLLKAIERHEANSNEELVLVFLAAARALGWQSRLVINFAVVPVKPTKPPPGLSLEGLKKLAESKAEVKVENQPDPEDKQPTTTKRKSSSTKEQGRKSVRDEKRATSGEKSNDQRLEPVQASTSRKRRSQEMGESDIPSKRSKTSDKATFRAPSRRSMPAPNTLQKTTAKRPNTPISPDRAKSKGKARSDKTTRRCSLSQAALAEARTRRSRQHVVYKEGSESESEAEKTSSKPRKKSRTKIVNKTDDSDDDFEMQPTASTSQQRKSIPAKSKPASKASGAKKAGSREFNYWAEIWTGKDWIPVDLIRGRLNCAKEMEERASKPMLYVVACDENGYLKDVTRRYAKDYNIKARKQRVDQKWLDEAWSPFSSPDLKFSQREDDRMARALEEAPMPTNVGALKNHPLYALQRHLLKFEGIYPPDAPPLGYVNKSEPVYARECVQTLHCRVTWMKQGRIVRINEEPYKIVKARPKWDRMSHSVIKDQPLDLFGKWQTEIYVPPPAEDGKVPRNEYGNVELFQKWMLPKGTVHLQVPGLSRVAKKLGIDCAPAMMGWEYNRGGCHPVLDGFVVCEEFQDTLLDAWNADQDAKKKNEEAKREKRILDNWKKLVKGLLIREKLKKKYKNH